MSPQDVLEQFRVEMSDQMDPPLWSDAEALQYFLEAQNRMVKVIGGIADVTVPSGDPTLLTSPPTRFQDLAVTTGAPWTAVSPYILRIRSARLLGARRDIPIINEADLNTQMVRDYGWTPSLSLDDADTGDVTHGLLGVRDNYIRWIRVPVVDDTVRLNFFRLPYPRPTSFDDTAIELPEDVHLHLVAGMRALAYQKQDAEAYDKTMAERMQMKFDMFCDLARKEAERKRYRRRQVQYGGL